MSDNQPPPLPTAPKPPKTFYHNAATYCLWAPFVGIGVNILLTAARVGSSTPTPRLEALLAALFLIIITLSGVVFWHYFTFSVSGDLAERAFFGRQSREF
jgi:hypothetical protein